MTKFDVAKEKGGRFYVFELANPRKPLTGTYCKEKKDALHLAAEFSGISYKEFMRERRNNMSIL